jgi:hypothetical protein
VTDRKVPKYAALGKFHKAPFGFRFLACSTAVATTELAQHVNALFKACEPAAQWLWERTRPACRLLLAVACRSLPKES